MTTESDPQDPFAAFRAQEVGKAERTIGQIGELAARVRAANGGQNSSLIDEQFDQLQTALDSARSDAPVSQ